MPVTLINVFSVPADKEAEFVQWWRDVRNRSRSKRIHQRPLS